MIVLIQGAPGSGKSYEAVAHHVVPSLKMGRKIITNLPLNIDEFAKLDPEYPNLIQMVRDYSPDIPAFSQIDDYESDWQGVDISTGKEIFPLFVIDECHKCLRNDMLTSEIAEWFALHRHRGVDVLLLTQHYTDISRAILNRVDHVIEVENLKRKGFKKLYIRRIYSSPGTSARLESTSNRRYQEKYFKLYTSYTLGGSGLEIGSTDKRPWWLDMPLVAMLAGVVAVALMIGGGLQTFADGMLGFAGVPPQVTGVQAKNTTEIEKKPEAKTVQKTSPQAQSKKYVLGIDLATALYRGFATTDKGIEVYFSAPNGPVKNFYVFELENFGYRIEMISACKLVMNNGGVISQYQC